MLYLKKTLKVLTLSLVICVLLFSVISAQAATTGSFVTFLPIPSIIATVPQITYFSLYPLYTPAPSDTSSLVYFEDSNLEGALMSELGVAPNDLTENYLGSLTGTLDLSNYNITSLTGIESLDNLDSLILRNNPITSRHELKRLKSLSNLEALDISALSVTVIPSEIGSMSNLKYLDISANRIDTLPSSFSNLNLDVLICNYCFFDIEDTSFVNTLIAATSTADYQYQLNKADFYLICQTSGIATAKWEEMPTITFPNGAVAEIQRFSICTPNSSGNQGAWLDSASSSATSYTFEGLDPTKTYSFDISADYYIKNTVYDGKYIKYYSKVLFQPVKQDTPTPKPTDTPEPTATPVITDTPAPTQAPVATTQASVDLITINPNQQASNNNNNNNNNNNSQSTNSSGNVMLTVLLIIVIVLILAIIGLIIVFFLKMNNTGDNNNQAPPR